MAESQRLKSIKSNAEEKAEADEIAKEKVEEELLNCKI